MQITIIVDAADDITPLDTRFPNEVMGEPIEGDECCEYWMGDPSDDDDLSEDDAVRAIGWIEWRIESAECCLGDSGPWWMQTIRKTAEYKLAYECGTAER